MPNFILEPRGCFLGERVGILDTLNTVRSVLGILIAAGISIYYGDVIRNEADGRGEINIVLEPGTLLGDWSTGVLYTVGTAILLTPVVALTLALSAERGYRKTTLYQLRWPFVSIVAFPALLVAAYGATAGTFHLAAVAGHLNVGLGVAAAMFAAVVTVIVVVWVVKACFYAVTGLFRADDGHPWLGVVVAPAVAWINAFLLSLMPGGSSGLPAFAGYATAYGGPISTTILSAYSVLILKQRYVGHYPFRRGPIREATAAGASPPPTRVGPLGQPPTTPPGQGTTGSATRGSDPSQQPQRQPVEAAGMAPCAPGATQSHPVVRVGVAVVATLLPWVTLGLATPLAFVLAAAAYRSQSRTLTAVLRLSATFYAAILVVEIVRPGQTPGPNGDRISYTCLAITLLGGGLQAVATTVVAAAKGYLTAPRRDTAQRAGTHSPAWGQNHPARMDS